MRSQSSTIVIHAKKMCQYLLARGFILIGVENSKKSRDKVFLFVDSVPLRQAMSEYAADKVFHNFLESMNNRR